LSSTSSSEVTRIPVALAQCSLALAVRLASIHQQDCHMPVNTAAALAAAVVDCQDRQDQQDRQDRQDRQDQGRSQSRSRNITITRSQSHDITITRMASFKVRQ
jgi:hypothetical protein